MDLQSLEIVATLNAENEYMELNEEGDIETQEPAQNETQPTRPTQSVFDSNTGVKADVWKEFVSVGIEEDGKERGRCIHCSKKLLIERNMGTSALRRHLLSCSRRPKNKSGGGNDGQDRAHQSLSVPCPLRSVQTPFKSKFKCSI